MSLSGILTVDRDALLKEIRIFKIISKRPFRAHLGRRERG